MRTFIYYIQGVSKVWSNPLDLKKNFEKITPKSNSIFSSSLPLNILQLLFKLFVHI